MVRNGFLEFQEQEDATIFPHQRRQRALTDSAIESGLFRSPALTPSVLPLQTLKGLQEALGPNGRGFQISEVSTETTGSDHGDSLPAASPRPEPSSSSASSNDGRAEESFAGAAADAQGLDARCPDDPCAQLEHLGHFEVPLVGRDILDELQIGRHSPALDAPMERCARPDPSPQREVPQRYFHDGPPPPQPKAQELMPAEAVTGCFQQEEQPPQPWQGDQWQWYGAFQPCVQWIPIIGEQVPVCAAPSEFQPGAEQWHGGQGVDQWQSQEPYWHVVQVPMASELSHDTSQGAAPSSSNQGPVQAHGASSAEGVRTTVMLRNLPTQYDRTMLMQLLDSEGFAGLYDFVYLPIDFRGSVCFGYGFINFSSFDAAECFRQQLDGFSRWQVESDKVAEVSWSEPLQGLEHHIERYRNSPLMHESVPDTFKPVLLSGGARIAFPPPTKKLRAPRVRNAKGISDPLQDC